jgi:EmrB/QacA subfamily drug resistance transporter
MSRGRTFVVTIGVLLGLLLAALDQTIVGTALPRIVSELRGLEYYSWVVTAYLVASTTMTPIAGKLGDLFGRKPLLLSGMAGFVAASALCGQSQDMGQLVAFRALQGVFGGVLFATVFASIADIYPPETRPKVQGLFGAVFAVASVIGPTLGGFLTDNLGWRWVFYVNLPLGLAAIAFVWLTMPAVRTGASWRSVDFLGAVTLATGLVPLLVALSLTQDASWTSPQVMGMLAFSAVVLTGFYFVERRAVQPIVPFWLFTNRTFAVSVVCGFLIAVGMFGTIVFVPLIYQGVLGISATSSGALVTPMSLGIVVASVISGQLMARLRYYRFVGTAGAAICIVGLLLLSQVTPQSSPLEVARNLVVVGFGVGLTFPLYLNSVQAALPRELTGVVTSQVQFWRNVGATVGVSLLGAVLAQRLPQQIERQVTTLDLPPAALGALGQLAGNAQALFDPGSLAQIPPQVLGAIRTALAASLHDVFLYAAVVVGGALVASVFLKDVPLRRRPGDTNDTPAGEREPAAPVPAFAG